MRHLLWLLVLTAAGDLPAQTPSGSLAERVVSEMAALGASPDLASWRNLHPDERLKNAGYDYEYETQGLWCAASVADIVLPGGIRATRQAFFYPPPRKPADTLPGRQDHGLVQKCRLLALWYEVANPASPAELAKSVSAGLSASLGSADEIPRFSLRRTDGDWGSGNWRHYTVWERADWRIVLAVDPGGPPDLVPDTFAKRLLVIARSSSAPRSLLVPGGSSFGWSGFEAPKGQPPLKDAPEVASIARVESPCSFEDGHNNWPRGLIRFGENLLRELPASRWRPYIHLTLARTYAARLVLTYPSADLNGADRPANPDTLRRNAIAHFRAFLEQNPESPETGSAWREAWRLLAGLPPSPIHFACTD